MDDNKVKAIFEAFDSSKTEEEMKVAFLWHQEIVFLYMQNFGTNKVNIFHHLSVVGGNFYQKQECLSEQYKESMKT